MIDKTDDRKIINLPTFKLGKQLDARAKRLAPAAEIIAEEYQRLEPVKLEAKELADRLANGEFSKSFMIEVSNFLDVPVEKLDALYLLLNAVDEKLTGSR